MSIGRIGLKRAASTSGLVRATAGLLTGVAGLAAQGVAWAEGVAGQPTDGAYGFQPTASKLGADAASFHDHILLPIITGICLLVLALLVWIAIRYNKRANPVPAKFSHNSAIEVIWTVVPVLILVFIAFHSFTLLRQFNDMPKADVVIKATGNQWYWTYDYPEQGVTGIDSRLLPEAADLKKAKAANVPYLLAVDNALVVPVNKVVQVQVTASDVIHAFAMPAFKIKVDAMPGRLNHVWFKAEKIGVYYGQCSELCGVDHAYMPIELHVVSQADYDAFIVKNGGKTHEMIAAEAKAKAAEEAAAAAAAASSASAAPADASSSSSSAAPAGAAAASFTTSSSAAPAAAAH